MNSEPLSESMPRSRKGSACRSSASAPCTAAWPLPRTAAVSTQVVWMSVRLSECTNSPSPKLPQWATRSISVKPGMVTSQRSVLARADGQQLPLHRRAQPQPPARPGQPQRQQRLEPERPRVAGRLPDHPQHLDDGRAVRRSSAPRWAGGTRRGPVEQPDGMLAVIASDLAELVQDPPLLRAPRVSVALIDGLHVLSFGSRTHDGFLHRLRKVTSQMAR